MRLQIILLFGFYRLLCMWCCNFATVEALVGENVRSAGESEFPFIVAIIKYVYENNMQRNYKCAGTLISRNDVLTSEHCLTAERLTRINVLVGSSYLNRTVRYYPEWWITYDQWANSNNHVIEMTDNDIGILNLLQRVPDQIVPAHVWSNPLELVYGWQAQIAGWGLSSNNEVPNILQEASVTILSKENCVDRTQPFYRSPVRVDERTICSVALPYVLLRSGDSGGPLFFQNWIIGVNFGTVPASIDNFESEGVNLHMHVTYYSHFISDLQDYY